MFRPLLFAVALLLGASPTPPAHRAPAHPAPAPRDARTARPAAKAPSEPSHHSIEDSRVLAADTLAWVGDQAVTALDLVQRIEWTPWPEKSSGAPMDTVKMRALESLAAERLLARESARRSPTGGSSLAGAREALRRALARDALFRQVAAGAVPPTAREIDQLARELRPGAPPGALPGLRRMAADSLAARNGQTRAATFLVSFLAGKRVDVDSTTFVLLADSLRGYMLQVHDDPVPGGGIIVPGEAPDVLLDRLQGSLEHTLAHLPDGPLTLGEALADMRFYLLSVHSFSPGRFARDLSAGLKLMVEGEIMAREAIRRRMDQGAEARHDLATWTDAWRARALLETMASGREATDDEAFRMLARLDPERARQVSEVDIQEILCGSLAEAQEVRLALDRGAAFDSLARLHSRRRNWAERGGRSGYFPLTSHLELGYTALLSPTDSLFGPGRLPEGFSVYRVLGKRLVPDSAVAAREVLERARGRAGGEIRSERLARYVASLAGGVNIRFATARLGKVEILQSNMVVKRSLGFGGGMTAAPPLPPIWQWTRFRGAGATALP